jgi:hypothetical protein
MENIFKNFAGADLDRLVDCIKAVRKAGLTIDEYCQAGVNQSSGNVYIWSEDWPGCVYCSVGFDVAWSYSCGECGNEVDFDSYHELCEYSDKCNDHDQHCESCADEWKAEE